MSWGSLENFLAMGGYGFYVWGAYAISLLTLAIEVAAVVHRRRALRMAPMDKEERLRHEGSA
ncbi:MAG: heme exporter protein CcmD [Pseudomonadota bacterium]